LRQITYTAQPSQEKHCKCGNVANCFITKWGWICKECYDKVVQGTAVHEAVAYIA